MASRKEGAEGAPQGTKKTRSPRKAALPAEIVALIEQHCATKATDFTRVNKGALTKAIEADLAKLRADAVAKVDAEFVAKRANGRLA